MWWLQQTEVARQQQHLVEQRLHRRPTAGSSAALPVVRAEGEQEGYQVIHLHTQIRSTHHLRAHRLVHFCASANGCARMFISWVDGCC
jgi:hypothetical protein